MNGFVAFTKKEFLEQLRSYRALILLAVLFLFGMISPLLAKLLPDILSGTVQGITINIPPPTVLDAYGQFFKNVGQMGLLALLLIFSGLLSQDVSRGTLIVLLAKGLPRHSVIGSKFISALIIWTAGYGLAALTAYGYTVYLFGNSTVPHLFFALFCLWLFGAFILALLLCASALAPGSYGGLLTSAGLLVIMLVLSSFPALLKWNPVNLAAGVTGLIGGTLPISDITPAVWSAAGLTVVFLVLAVIFFRKKKL